MDIVYPLARGDFVLRKYDNQVARVRSIWWDFFDQEFCMNLSIFSHRGDNVGRVSPACGGPTNFEPAVTFRSDEYERIDKPRFPIHVPLKWVDNGSGSLVAQPVADVRVMPFRQLKRREKITKPKLPRPSVSTSDYNPILEAATRRMTAQNLRDMARTVPEEFRDTLKQQAKKLEDEAEKISPIWHK